MQKVHRPVRTRHVIGFLSQRVSPSMEIHANCRLNQARNNSCTNARSTPTRSCGYGEFKNANPRFVQNAHRPVRTRQIIGFLYQRIRPSIEIHANLRLNQARNNGCTNARSIPTRSCGYGEFKNVNPGFVQKAHRPVRTRQLIGFLSQRIRPSIEIHAN